MKQQENDFNYTSIIEAGFWNFSIENLDTEYWVDLIYNFKTQHPKSMTKSNEGGYQSSSNLYSYPPLIPLSRLIQDSLYKLFPDYYNTITSLWLNISSYGCYNHIHNHAKDYSNKYSGVLYLKTPKNSGSLTFYNPLNLNDNFYIINPKEKDIVIFPSHLYHSVEPNLSQEDRISIAFNFN